MSKKIDIDPNDIYISTMTMVQYAEHFSEEECKIIESTYRSMSNIEDPGVSLAYFNKFLYEEHFELLTCPNCGETCYFKWRFLGYHKHSDCGHSWMETPWRSLWEKIKRLLGPLKGEVKFFTALSLLALPLQLIVYLISSRSKAQDENRENEPQPVQPGKVVEQIVELGAGVSLTLVKIPSGSFVMGGEDQNSNPDEELPAHRVSFDRGFWLGKCQVTQAQYRAVTGSSPSKHVGDDHPVENLSWEEAQAFFDALNKLAGTTDGAFRLPTEAEWEYACRAGNTGYCCFGNNVAVLSDYAWYDKDRPNGDLSGLKYSLDKKPHRYLSTHPVGQKKANAWGLHDMHGNVSEWCADEWHDNYEGAPSDGRAWENGDGDRIVRGGHFRTSAVGCRSACRDGREPNGRFEFVGLRVARTASD